MILLKKISLFGSLLLVFNLFFACKEKIDDYKVGNCSTSEEEEILTENHPKGEIYQGLLDRFAKKRLPGLVFLVESEDDGVWIGSSGVSRIEDNTPMQTCNLFLSGGVAQLFTAAATMNLIEEGVFKLESPISGFIPQKLLMHIPNGQSINIGHLLSHTSGIIDFEDDPNFLMDFLNNPKLPLSREIILKKYISQSSPLFFPGSKQKYSSSNYEILALILDQVTEKKHAKLFSDRIINKLNLKRTFYRNEAGYPNMENKGMINGYIDRMSVGKLENSTDIMLNYANNLSGSRGVVGTAYDYYKFLKNLFENNITSEESLEKMQNYLEKKYGIKEETHGLGLSFRNTRYGLAIGHKGSTFGNAIELWFFPKQKTYLFLGTNVSTFIKSPSQNNFEEDLWEDILREIF